MADPLEIRVALVMNGGVSLAVWMAGVTHELDLLRRASKGLAPPEDQAERALYDMWRQLCKTLNVKVTVDVVSGSSAGGVNGVLLATGIAKGAPLSQLRAVWEETAQLDADHLLLPVGQADATSVLDGDFFADEIKRVVETIGPGSAKDGEDVTLFVTATAVGEQSRRVRDSDGAAFTVPDHRCLYRFGRQARRVYAKDADPEAAEKILDLFPESDEPDPFENSSALSRAARATASFPGAFAPVPEQVFAEPGSPPGLEQYRVAGSDGTWLMDGGVLDNAPFGPVLQELARRPVDNVWRRTLVYVVPSVDGDAGKVQGSAPGWQRVVLQTLFLPREVDLRSDIDAVQSLLAESERWGGGQQSLFSELRTAPQKARDNYSAAAATLFDRYRRARINGGIVDAFNAWAQEDTQDAIGLTPAGDLPDIVEPLGWVPSSVDEIKSSQPWNWGTAVADRVLRLMLRDIANPKNHPGLSAAARRTALRRLSIQLECVTAVRDVIVQRVQELSPDEPDATVAVNAINQAVAEFRVGPTLVRLVHEGAEAYASATASTRSQLGASEDHPDQSDEEAAADALADALTAEVLAGAFTADRAFSRPVPFTFFRFGPDVDSPLFAVPDPEDPNQSLPLGPWKLWGSKLGNFAAFGRPEWRENDWLWGRLDGAAHLVRLIVSQSETTDVNSREHIELIQQAILVTQGEGALKKTNKELRAMPGLKSRDVLQRWAEGSKGMSSVVDTFDSVLRTLRNEGAGNNETVAAIGRLATILIGEEIPEVLQDDIGERAEWVASKVFGLRGKLQRYLLGEDLN